MSVLTKRESISAELTQNMKECSIMDIILIEHFSDGFSSPSDIIDDTET
jgi:hypothetical protein